MRTRWLFLGFLMLILVGQGIYVYGIVKINYEVKHAGLVVSLLAFLASRLFKP